MEMGLRLGQEQQLKLVMTPRLQQSIKILQYSATDLVHYMREQTEQNPFMELEEPELLKADTQSGQRQRNQDLFLTERETAATFTREQEAHPFDFYIDKDESLAQYLFEQIQYLSMSTKERRRLRYLVGNLDENGYLDASFETAPAELFQTEEEWEEAVSVLQQLEPTGVGARDLIECLLLQAKKNMPGSPYIEHVIGHHLLNIANHNYRNISTDLQISVTEVERIVADIQSLQPKPGMAFQQTGPAYITPDVLVDQVSPGQYVVQVNDSILPRVTFQKGYGALMDQHEEAKKFVHERWQQYQWLVRSIEQRKQTLLEVSEAIMDKQVAVLERGWSALKPLSLQEIAAQLGIHESTVSRATNQKYAQTPLGVVELKRFFAGRVAKAGGEDTSDAQVKHRIQTLIDQEDPQKPLSDQKIVHLLQEEGIGLARRTVAKYRDQLGILSSSRRKRRI